MTDDDITALDADPLTDSGEERELTDTEMYQGELGGDVNASEADMEVRVREALRADAATSRYAEDLVIGTRGSVVGVRGLVDDIDDTDDVTEVISRVTGVSEVIDELDVKGLTD